MKNVIFLSSDNINAQTGAAKFSRLLISCPEMWRREGFNLMNFSNSDTFSDEQIYRKSFKYRIKQTIKYLLGRTSIGKRIRFFNYYIKQLGNTPILKIDPYVEDSTCYILNDLRVAWNFYERYGDKYKTIFIMHNSGYLLSMMKDEMTEKHICAFLENCEKVILRNATQLVFVSEIARKNFIAVYPEYDSKTKTIYIGMDIAQRHNKILSERVRFVTVGTVCKRKNQILAIKAVELLKDKEISLTIVGGGPELSECQEYVKKHCLENMIEFTGASDKVEEILEKNDVFIMTSNDEGLPVAAQEAMAAGLPLILTDVGGCRELVSYNGVLIRPKLDEVVKAMEFFKNNRKQINECGEKSYQLYQNRFSLVKMQHEYIELIKTIYKG